jgi:hypothetical protein
MQALYQLSYSPRSCSARSSVSGIPQRLRLPYTARPASCQLDSGGRVRDGASGGRVRDGAPH